MKKILLAVAILCSSFNLWASGTGNINQKVLNAFNKTFKDVKNANWSESDQYYVVSFHQDKVLTNITYDHEGNIVKTLRYYNEDHLPLLVLTRLRSKYANMKIFGVTEESSEEGTIYHVVLEDQHNWLHVNATATGSLSFESKYNKA